jgi:hypothetical protein
VNAIKWLQVSVAAQTNQEANCFLMLSGSGHEKLVTLVIQEIEQFGRMARLM